MKRECERNSSLDPNFYKSPDNALKSDMKRLDRHSSRFRQGRGRISRSQLAPVPKNRLPFDPQRILATEFRLINHVYSIFAHLCVA